MNGKYVAKMTLYFLNNQPFIIQGRKYEKGTYDFCVTMCRDGSTYTFQDKNRKKVDITADKEDKDKIYYKDLFKIEKEGIR